MTDPDPPGAGSGGDLPDEPPHRHGPAGADSGGVPWAGRTLTPNPFAGDDGAADPAVAAALARAGEPGGRAAVVAALAGTRVLVPVMAVAGDSSTATATGLVSDASADMAVVTLTAPDGRRALPVFTCAAALSAWDTTARPVPSEVARAALSAVDEGCDLLVVDPAGPSSLVVPRPAVWALAQQVSWTPSPERADVAAAVGAAAQVEASVRDVRCEPGRGAELAVVLALEPGLDRAALSALLERVQTRLAASQVVADAVDSLELRVVAAGSQPG